MYTKEFILDKIVNDQQWAYRACSNLLNKHDNLLSAEQKLYLDAFYKYYIDIEMYVGTTSKNNIILEQICKNYISELVDIDNDNI